MSCAKKRANLFSDGSNVTSTPTTRYTIPTKSGRAVVATTGQTTSTEQSATRGHVTRRRTMAADENKPGVCAVVPPEACKPHGLVARLRSKLRKPTRCEKCRQRSDTCRPNASFVLGRKHYLCDDCRVSSDNIKNLYHQLLHTRRSQHLVCETKASDVAMTDLAVSDSLGSSSNTDRSGTAAESGYDTAASSDSVGSERLGFHGHSCTPTTPSPGAVAAPRPRPPSYDLACSRRQQMLRQCDEGCVLEQDAKSKFETAAEGGREDGHLESVGRTPEQRHAARMQELQQRLEGVHLPSNDGRRDDAIRSRPAYDGYLEISRVSSRANLRTLKSPAATSIAGRSGVRPTPLPPPSRGFGGGDQGLGSSTNRKTCSSCWKSTSVAFRLPWKDAWICEDCMDDMI